MSKRRGSGEVMEWEGRKRQDVWGSEEIERDERQGKGLRGGGLGKVSRLEVGKYGEVREGGVGEVIRSRGGVEYVKVSDGRRNKGRGNKKC